MMKYDFVIDFDSLFPNQYRGAKTAPGNLSSSQDQLLGPFGLRKKEDRGRSPGSYDEGNGGLVYGATAEMKGPERGGPEGLRA